MTKRTGLLAIIALAINGSVFAANLIPNGSFEAGLDSRVVSGRWYVDGLTGATTPTGNAAHGSYSLKVPFSRAAYSTGQGRIDGIEVRSGAPIEVKSGVTYSFSVSLRTDSGDVARLALLGTAPDGRPDKAPLVAQEAYIGKSWKRHSVTWQAPQDQLVWWSVTASSSVAGNVWLDALQFEENRPSKFTPAREIEAAVSIPAEAGIFASRSPVIVGIRVANQGLVQSSAAYDVAIVNVQGKQVWRQSLLLDVPAQATASRSFFVRDLPNGSYRVALRDSAGQLESDAQFSIIPRARTVAAPNSAFGIYATVAPYPLRVLRRLGFRWLGSLTTNSRMIYWNQVEPARGQFVWYDEDQKLVQSNGFEMMFNLEPCRTPSWATGLPVEERRRLWANFVRRLAEHYRSAVRYWTIADEVSTQNGDCWRDLNEYAQWHAAGVEALRSVDPGFKVILNSNGDFSRTLLTQMAPGSVDVVADNTWHLLSRNLGPSAILAAEKGLPLWSPGVGIAVEPWYPRHRGNRDNADSDARWANANRDLTVALLRAFGMGTVRIFQYDGVHPGNTDRWSLFEADSTLRPTGARFASLIWLLDDTLTVEVVDLKRFGKKFEVYRFDRRDGYTVFALIDASGAGHEVLVPTVAGMSPMLFDADANQRAPSIKLGRYSLGELGEPVFVVVATSGADRFEESLSKLSTRLERLPAATDTKRAGKYALLRGVKDDAWRPEPNVSLWFYSEHAGWIEILRYRASIFPAEYRVTASGFELSWDLTRPTEPFYLGPGEFPPEFLDGARLLASRQGPKGLEWQVFKADLAKKSFVSLPVSGVPGSVATPLTLIVDGGAPEASSRVITTFATQLQGESFLNNQHLAFGGWDLIARPEPEFFLHRYYFQGQSGRIAIRVDIRAEDAGP